MGTTNTDMAAIIASIGGLAIAVVGILSEPLDVDTSRPIVQNSASGSNNNAFARLWDDPFAPFPSNDNPGPANRVNEHPAHTLVLVVPVDTQLYEEDRESRLRSRYAVHRALLDAGFAPVEASVLYRLKLHFPPETATPANALPPLVQNASDSHNQTTPGDSPLPVTYSPPSSQDNGVNDFVAPTQLFRLRPMVEAVPGADGTPRFTQVVVVWLPDLLLWRNNCRPKIFSVIDKQLTDFLKCRFPPSYVLLGPWDSDQLACLETASRNNPGDVIQNPGNNNVCRIVSYRATVADALLERITRTANDQPDPGGVVSISYSSARTDEKEIYRVGAEDDSLCQALLKEIAFREFAHKQIRILVFSEWDTLYGRSLVETLRALASCDEKPVSISEISFSDLRHELIKLNPALAKPDLNEGNGPTFSITVIPYLRGLDGTSTLYSKAYPHLADADAKEHRQQLALEPAEGTTQFDYLRRSTSHVLQQPAPFIPFWDRPDAIIIFGSDVYDKLILLKFLKQTLRNCLYMTTDLDALFWHPDYLQYTKGLVVASAFPLQMVSKSSTLAASGEPSLASTIQFRDAYQSAAYWSVLRILQAGDSPLDKWISEDPVPVQTFQVGNSEPLQIGGKKEHQNDDWSGSTTFSQFNLRWLDDLLDTVLRPVFQGVSPFWSVLIQCAVIGLALFALRYDIPTRTSFPQPASTRLWEAAIDLLPSAGCQDGVESLRNDFRRRWATVKIPRDRNEDAEFFKQNPPLPDVKIPLDADPEKQCQMLIAHFESRLESAKTKAAIARLALSFLSTVFHRYAAVPDDAPETNATIARPSAWHRDLLPIVNYIESQFRFPPDLIDEEKNQTVHPWIKQLWRLFSPLFPSKTFFVLSVLAVALIGIICAQPEVYLVGPETRTPFWRCFRWSIETLALLSAFGVFHRVCFEQARFRRLINKLSALIGTTGGLSNRRIVVILSDASEPITHLSFTPCALALLLFLSHLRPLGGVPITTELYVLLTIGLSVLTYSFFLLRTAALSQRDHARRSYEDDAVTSRRLITRLNSYVTEDGPLQDTEASLVNEITALVTRNSDVSLPVWFPQALTQLRKQEFRDKLCNYLRSCGKRNQEIVSQLSRADQGVFSPLLTSPTLNALLIPVGGAGGISLLTWLLTFAK